MNAIPNSEVANSKMVFRLRREGRLEEALEMGRVLYNSPQIDIWGVRALAWVLHDLVKATALGGSRKQAQAYFEEWDGLTLDPVEDALLVKQREYWRGMMSPSGQVIVEAAAASKAKDHGKALALYRKAVAEMPDSQQAQTGLAWELFHELNGLARQDPPEIHGIRELLGEYADLSLVEKPGKLHSMLLSVAVRVAEHFPGFPAFVGWWDVANLQTEDWVEQHGEGDTLYPSLGAKVVRSLYKAVKGGEHAKELPWITELTRQAIEKCPKEEWFPYYYGNLLIRQGQLHEAREWVLPVIRLKTREFWAWDVLASTYGTDEKELKMACLAKALQCRAQDESFKINVMQEMAVAMVELGDYAEAKHEIERIVAVRAGRGWQIPEAVTGLQSEPWFEVTEAASDNAGYYAEIAVQAEKLVYEGLPWFKAVVSGRVHGEPGVKPAVYLLVQKQGGNQELRVTPRGFAGLQELALGSPVSVRLVSHEQRDRLVDVKVREGAAWDLLAERAAVVSWRNEEKRVAVIPIGIDQVTLAHFDAFQEARGLEVGQCLMVRIQSLPDGLNARLVSFRKVETIANTAYARIYKGVIRINEEGGFGFADDVFINPGLCRGYPDQSVVTGVALFETNPKTLKRGWRALTMNCC